LSTILQIVGAATVSVGVGTIFVPAGIILAGIFAIVFGIAMERNNAE
jgi:hypothetical protein